MRIFTLRNAERAADRKRRRGIAVLELAFIVPFLVLLMLGIFELARGIMIKQMLNDAARRACRQGIRSGKTNADIITSVNNILTDNGIPTSDGTTTITITPSGVSDVSQATPGIDSVSVKIAIPISDVFWAGTTILSGSTLESDYAVMLKQG